MKGRIIKVLIIVIGIVLTILAMAQIFYLIDYNRVKNNLPPLFCFIDDEVNDGGTIIYKGFGYKVIDYNTMDGYNEVHIGSWSMQYEDWVN